MTDPWADAVNALCFLHDPDEVFELCVIRPKKPTSELWAGRANGKKATISGWFTDPETAARIAVEISNKIRAEGIYTTLNPCMPAIHARAENRLEAAIERTADNHISCIKNLLIDIDADPGGVSGVSSTDAEHEAALEMAQFIMTDLTTEGWPEPMPGDSGNGGHLIYAVDLPNTEESKNLIKSALEALALRYHDEMARRNLGLDTAVFNPARLTKLFGTMVRKGDSTKDRPHRLAKILSLPETRRPVPPERLQKLAETLPKPETKPNAESGEARLDVAAYLAHHGVEVVKVKPHKGGFLYCLKECLFDSSHSDNEAAIGQAADGKLFYQCFHNSCRGRTWAEARRIISGHDRLSEFIIGGNAPQTKTISPTKTGPKETGDVGTPDYGLTDQGNAYRFKNHWGRDVRWCDQWGKFLYWDERRWTADQVKKVELLAIETVRSMYAEASQIRDKDARKAMADHAKRSEADSKRKAMLSSVKCLLPILPEGLDRNPFLLNVMNGTVDLQTGELRPHSREDFLTKVAPVHFDPQTECPLWWNFLSRILPPEAIEFVQKAVGYSATGLTVEQVFFLLYGGGDNGKTTFLEAIGGILGDYAKETDPETFMLKKHSGIPNDLAALRGARFVKSVETSGGRRMSETRIKQMTGGDTLTARFLHAEWFEFRPEFKLWLATNHKPVIRDSTHSMWRRVRFIPFEVQIPKEEQDKRLSERLKEEYSGILNWIIEGALLWQHEGLEPPESIRLATQDYREEMDDLSDFLSECCIIAPGASDTAKVLFEAYTDWAEKVGEKKPLSQKAFGMALGERGFHNRKGAGGVRVWHGLGVKD